jgi:hypothetical protein
LMKHYLNFFDRNEKTGVVDGGQPTLKLIKWEEYLWHYAIEGISLRKLVTC